MQKAREFVGKKINKLFINAAYTVNGESFFDCVCDCGKRTLIPRYCLTRKKNPYKSCGCWRRERIAKINFIHGQYFSRLHNIWNGMVQRCSNQKSKDYVRYGGRGIKVCQRWREFKNFYQDVNASYEIHVERFGIKNTTIERINNNKGYTTRNYCWATYKEQANNRRNNKK